jgi:FAD/FMN-containing dehydrogenase
MDMLLAEYGLDVIDLRRRTKLAWDPKQILNPGKIF